jgi:hypothetical protein
MPTYQVTRKADSEHVYRYQADAPIEWTGMEFATHDHIEQVEIDPDGVIEGTVTGRVMTKLEFLRRFTQEERVAIRTVAKSNVVLEDYMAMIDLAQEIDTSDADTRAGVQMLESVGLLAEGRAQEILNG